MNRFIRELRRREVFRTAGLYIGVAWISIEVASVMLPAFEAPDWVLRAFIVVALVGFPVSLVLAWAYDITDEGVEVQAEATDTVVIPFGGRKMDFVVIGVLSVALILSVYMNITSGPDVEVQPEPLSVLIADFVNTTGDELFDGTLEQALQIGIESAPFITGYRRDAALKLASRLQPTEALDEVAARLVAVREGVKLVMAGSIEEDNGSYTLYVRAVDPKGGEELISVEVDAKDKLDVLAAIGTLAGDLREELGDKSLDREKLRASETFTAKNLEAAQAYARGQSLAYNAKYEESIEYFKKALEHDPEFGRAYTTLALSAGSLGRTDEAGKYWEKALNNLGTMTARERLRTLAIYYSRVTRNREKAIEAYTELVEKYPADDAAHNGLAIQYFYTLDFDAALEAGGKLLEIYPSSVMGRSNYALYAMYASDFDTAIAEAEKVRELDPDYFKGWLPVAMKALAEGDDETARAAYESMSGIGFRGASTANLGRADLAIYNGDYDTARTLLRQGIAGDEAANSQYFAATKYIALAEAELGAGNHSAAIEALETGLGVSAREAQSVPAALMYLELGQADKSQEIAVGLGQQLPPKARAHGLLIDGMIALENGEHVRAIDALSSAIELADLWLARFYRGRAFLEGGFFAEALDDFMACQGRRGEATAVFLDDLPTYRYMATLPYWLGRAQEGLGMTAEARENYTTFVGYRPEGDPLADDARQRLQ
jgi:tetratricopeptide (TPR) repeat protein